MRNCFCHLLVYFPDENDICILRKIYSLYRFIWNLKKTNSFIIRSFVSKTTTSDNANFCFRTPLFCFLVEYFLMHHTQKITFLLGNRQAFRFRTFKCPEIIGDDNRKTASDGASQRYPFKRECRGPFLCQPVTWNGSPRNVQIKIHVLTVILKMCIFLCEIQ